MNYEKWAFHDITPISRQLIQKLIYAILSNELSSGNSIPSVREMAEILHINPNTVLKSYKAVKQEHLIICSKGGKYFVTRNGSSLLAFRVPAGAPAGFLMAAAHTDSPTFKIKHNPEKKAGPYVQLSTEKYGGMLMGTWFDRPLSVAGRVVTAKDGKLETKLVDVDCDLLVIPSVAIHMNRAANDGFKLMANVDTLPLYGMQEASGSFRSVVAAAAGVKEDEILGEDLSLYVRTRGTVFGAKDEFLLAPRLDDLGCVFGLLEGFLAAAPSGSVPVFCAFDNEEVGSGTKQGADSSFLTDTMARVGAALGADDAALRAAACRSFMVSADNAHAVHPNHPELADANEAPVLNGGVVVKHSPRYATDAVSAAAFQEICRRAQVPTQHYANRPDQAGGATLGNIANTKLPVNTVDIGMAQLAMHSCFETMGSRDVAHFVRAVTACYEAALTFTDTQVTLG